MIIIKHRVNTISSLKKTQENLGVEIDLRSKNKQLYLHHDPFKNGVLFSKWLRHYKHSFIVLNVNGNAICLLR